LLGDEAFIDQFHPLLMEKRNLEEVPRLQRLANRKRRGQA